MDAQEYDFIIVGAGSAGCILADRLSANGRYTVLVLEAGGSDNRFWIKVPLGYAFTFSDPSVNWRYTAEPDAGLKGRQLYWPRGRVVGGSGSINAMAYVRGLTQDFDDWQAAGAVGWSADTVFPTYDRLEGKVGLGDNDHQGRPGIGSCSVADLQAGMHPFSERFLEAASEMGLPVFDDMNASGSEGFSRFRSTVRGGRRWSSADAFLRPALSRDCVDLKTEAIVESLVFDGRRTTGVRYRHQGCVVKAVARYEVILSAGAVNSPQLLQVSGIGAGAHLQSVGVKVVHNLPQVGQGLQDHLTFTRYFEANVPTLNTRLSGWFGQMLAGIQYLATRKGPLSVPVNQVGGFVRSLPDLKTPDVQVYCNPASYSVRADGLPVIDRAPGFLLCVQPCRPTSRGQINITSPDPAHAPSIQPNSLSTNKDCVDAINAVRWLGQLASTPTLKTVTKAWKGADITQMSDEARLDDFRENATTNFHPTCTCRMGRSATDSVLDSRLRVHGLSGLRVVDASAFPNITSGNTNAPTMMLALRAADLILEDAQKGHAGEPYAA